MSNKDEIRDQSTESDAANEQDTVDQEQDPRNKGNPVRDEQAFISQEAETPETGSETPEQDQALLSDDAPIIDEPAETEEVLPLLPLRGTVVLPLTLVPLAAAQARSLRLIDDVMAGERTVAMVMQKDAETEGAGPDDILEIGTIATIHQMMRVPDGTVRLAVQGVDRMKIIEVVQEEPYLKARVRRIPEVVESTVEVQALMLSLIHI